MPLLLLMAILLIPSPSLGQALPESPDQVWQVGERRWTIEEEGRFGKWVGESITEDFFIRSNIPTDCADAVYAIRWIYARIHHLPAAATTKDGRLVGHWSTDWKDLPTHPDWESDARFRAALFYLFPRTWTGTLPHDTYPVRISPDSITPGTVFLEAESHAGIVASVFLDGGHPHPVQAWESALPVKIQKLGLRYFFCGKPDLKTRSGLLKFRWPVRENGEWKYLSARNHPFYSEEQYASAFYEGCADFMEAVSRRIDPGDYSPMEKAARVMETITRALSERAPVVRTGYLECRHGLCPEGSELWELHSTHRRDAMIHSLMDHLSTLIASNRLDKSTVRGMMESIGVAISENRSLTLYETYQNHPWLSSHPEDSIEARWGLEKCRMIHAQTRATRDSIAFIERTYRKRDPRYADFSLREQRRILQSLQGEWTRSECREPAPVQRTETRAALPKMSAENRRDPKKCETIRRETRTTKDSIAFIENRYRKTDPDYADFSIRTQQNLAQRLNEEWTSAGCGGMLPGKQKK